MKIKNKNKLFVSMIMDDLIYTKLMSGLKNLNLEPAPYLIDIGDKVITLMGFSNAEQNEAVYAHYLRLLERGRQVSLENGNTPMLELAREIYRELRLQKSVKVTSAG